MANVTAPQFQQDVNNASEWANGDENKTVTMRLGQQADSPAKVIKRIDDLAAAQREDIYENATPLTIGNFTDGFTYTALNQRGEFGGDQYVFLGGLDGLPHVVAPATDPTVPPNDELYAKANYNDAASIANANGGNVQNQLDIKNGLTVSEAVNYAGIASLLGSRVWLTDRQAWFEVVLSSSFSGAGADMDELTSSANPVYGLELIDKQNADGFGARTFTDPTDVKNCLQRFFDVIGVGGYGEIEEHTYVIDGTLSIEEKINAHIKFNGDVEIKSNNGSEPVIAISGRILKTTGIPEIGFLDSVDFSGFVYDRESNQGVAVLYTGLARCLIDGWRIRHAYIPEKINRATGFTYPNGQNAIFSTTFLKKDIADVYHAFFDYRAFNGGNTGCVVVEMYMTNFINDIIQPCDRFGWIGTTSEWTFGQLNFERAEVRHLITFSSDVDSINAESIHIEGVIPTANSEGFFFFNNNTNFKFGVMTIVKPYIDGTLTSSYSLFRVGNNVTINGMVKERDTEITAGSPNLRVVQYSGTGTESSVNLSASKLDQFKNLEFGVPQGLKPVLTVDDVYPAPLIRFLTDSSITWGPHRDEKTVFFDGLTQARSFIVDVAREYEGMKCRIINNDSTFQVNVSLNVGSFTGTVLAGETKDLIFDGANYYLL